MIWDTNALSAWADGAQSVREAMRECREVFIPVIVLGEYLFGIRKSRYREEYEEWLRKNLPKTQIVSVTAQTANYYASLRLRLAEKGRPIPVNDMWIAALTLELGLPLLSRDAHFDVVPGLVRKSYG
ncbi:hypothetical protein AXK11_00865 [Cephaloticoccus primus]|uniref:Ribonuclease VapC n=1 Tax=Cephaloticoccus primus TaxID=1548207 RepID=A0A139SUU2_9BACT|nr:type II toxin-antitoxin system VapC family toxin [Cephaloticoccus primus]KXU38232.1 hypothetical protein AXK11_00865 [Cephaloticoccus primus]